MRALNRKLLREVVRLRGQVLAIGLVVGSGAAVLVMSLSTLEALEDTTGAYYERYRFADVFASATRVPERVAQEVAALPGLPLGQERLVDTTTGEVRAPERVALDIAALPGVQFVQTRVSRYALLDVTGFPEPIMGRLTSIPEAGQPVLNRLALRSGRWVAPGRHDEVILNEPFAEAHELVVGDTLAAVLNGRRRVLTVVGTALSPEFVYTLAPGSLLPDDRRFGILWMGREALAAAFDLEGAFNDLSVSLLPDASPEPVIDRIDRLLAPYGGVDAVSRADQMSNWFVMNEIEQIRTMAFVLPAIFLGVAAFLGHMVLGRLVATERAEIGLLKAFGYRNFEIGWHYAHFVIVLALVGIVLGSVLGAVLGRYNTQSYAEFFRFPLLIYRPSTMAFAVAGLASVLAMLLGALDAVRRAVVLPPAEAMRPPAPPRYRHGRLASRWLDQPTRIALRQITRWPVRAALTAAGIALSVALLVMSVQWNDAVDHIAESFFDEAQHQTLTLGLAEPRASTVVNDARHLPGVMVAEPWRVASANFRAGTREHRGALTGIAPRNRLRPVHDDAMGTDVAVPPAGLLLGGYLADKLGVNVGDQVHVQILEGRRPAGPLPVTGVFETAIAMPAYMDLDAMNRWLGSRPTVEYLDLLVDPLQVSPLLEGLKEIPGVSTVMLKRAAIDAYYATLAEHLLIFIGIFTLLACALAFGVVYNSIRIALSERGRELATLRVLGFTRQEIAYVLLGEVSLLVLVALPLGCLSGWALTRLLSRAFDTELFRMPFQISAASYGYAICIALAAAVISAALVGRRLARLDLIRVLKTRE